MVPATRRPRCGKTLDVGLALISVGLAWWFSRYAEEQSAEERGRYKSEEEEAHLRKRGLWVDSAPVPPWEMAQVQVARLSATPRISRTRYPLLHPSATGILRVNIAPLLTPALSAESDAPCSLASRLAIASPSPSPPPRR